MQATMSHSTGTSVCRPTRNSTGTVKMTPEFEVFTDDAIVCAMLFSMIVPFLSRPRSTPQPSTAAIALPPRVKPIFSPEYVMAAFITRPIRMPKTTADTVTSR